MPAFSALEPKAGCLPINAAMTGTGPAGTARRHGALRDCFQMHRAVWNGRPAVGGPTPAKSDGGQSRILQGFRYRSPPDNTAPHALRKRFVRVMFACFVGVSAVCHAASLRSAQASPL